VMGRRYVHASIHLTSNRLTPRNRSFVLGLVVLGLGWTWLALHLLEAV
jgi:hypothetical protein